MFLVGITGGIGSGKSTVAKLFSNLGVSVVDADQSAREVVKPGCPSLEEIEQHFGTGVILDSGELNRGALRERIFTNNAERQWLESLLHPLIFEHIKLQLANAPSDYAILESPLLLETTQKELVNRVLVVDVPENVQLERALLRDNATKQEIKAIMAAQISRNERLSRADDVILNNKGRADLDSQVLALHQQYLTYAKQK